MEYNYGLQVFLDAKSLSPNEAINLYLQHKNITNFSAKNYKKVNEFIEKNWNNFAQFIDVSLKNKTLSGNRVRLGGHYAELKERNKKVKAEFKEVNLNKDEDFILSNPNAVYSFFAKNGIEIPKKDKKYTAKKLQNITFIEALKFEDLLLECVEYIKEFNNKTNKQNYEFTKNRE